MNISCAIKIQSVYRGYCIRKKCLIPSSEYQTKKWRQLRHWYLTGKSNECEKYQIKLVESLFKKEIKKTNDRINYETLEITDCSKPFKFLNGFEFSENFDGKYMSIKHTIYFNLKFVCDKGGAQTRTLREVYLFVKKQLQYLLKNKTQTIFFF